MTTQEKIGAVRIGAIAQGLLAHEPEAQVWGITSRGLFIHLASGWIIFLSQEDIPGPLTLNLPGERSWIESMQIGDLVRVSSPGIDIPKFDIHIDISQAEIWQARSPLKILIDRNSVRERLAGVSQRAIQILSQAGRQASPLFLSYLSPPAKRESVYQPYNPWLNLLISLVNAWEGKHTQEIAEGLQALLGLGNGLTPSGDDVVLGFLLTLNRWGRQLAPAIDVGSISGEIVLSAYSKTTRLSANLIECAASGQADERLIASLDGLVSGSPDPGQCAAMLANWGNTSGLDALVGMGIAIS